MDVVEQKKENCTVRNENKLVLDVLLASFWGWVSVCANFFYLGCVKWWLGAVKKTYNKTCSRYILMLKKCWNAKCKGSEASRIMVPPIGWRNEWNWRNPCKEIMILIWLLHATDVTSLRGFRLWESIRIDTEWFCISSNFKVIICLTFFIRFWLRVRCIVSTYLDLYIIW
jgi:hypothetical protein